MIECIFTLDYEIYGNGTGALKDLVYDPTERLTEIFRSWNARFVAFVEAAELERIEYSGADPAIDLVKCQIRDLYQDGFEIGLHLHPQWYNATYEHGRWVLDSREYNLCTLPRARITEILERSLKYMRQVVDQPAFTPLSFRAGSWLFQPTEAAASVIAECGIKIDSSLFKGGVQHNYGLDYRPALGNGHSWRFSTDINKRDSAGALIELPIHTEMVPFWRMATSKRIGHGNTFGMAQASTAGKLNRALDFLRLSYPMKLDFCRMTANELTAMLDRVIQDDRQEPAAYRPVVAIGHTKDFTDPKPLEAFLSFLRKHQIAASTFEVIYPKLLNEQCARRP